MHDTFDTRRAIRQATLILTGLAAVLALAVLSPADPGDGRAAAGPPAPAQVAAR